MFSTYPRSDTTDRKSQVAAYALALEGHDPRDVEAAIRKLMRGEVDWHNSEFPPSAPLLGTVVIACRDERLDREQRQRRYNQPQITARQEEHSPESRARVKAMVDGFVKGTAKLMQTDDAAAHEAGHAKLVEKTQKRFDPPQYARALNERLVGRNYGLGNDAEGEAE